MFVNEYSGYGDLGRFRIGKVIKKAVTSVTKPLFHPVVAIARPVLKTTGRIVSKVPIIGKPLVKLAEMSPVLRIATGKPIIGRTATSILSKVPIVGSVAKVLPSFIAAKPATRKTEGEEGFAPPLVGYSSSGDPVYAGESTPLAYKADQSPLFIGFDASGTPIFPGSSTPLAYDVGGNPISVAPTEPSISPIIPEQRMQIPEQKMPAISPLPAEMGPSQEEYPAEAEPSGELYPTETEPSEEWYPSEEVREEIPSFAPRSGYFPSSFQRISNEPFPEYDVEDSWGFPSFPSFPTSEYVSPFFTPIESSDFYRSRGEIENPFFAPVKPYFMEDSYVDTSDAYYQTYQGLGAIKRPKGGFTKMNRAESRPLRNYPVKFSSVISKPVQKYGRKKYNFSRGRSYGGFGDLLYKYPVSATPAPAAPSVPWYTQVLQAATPIAQAVVPRLIRQKEPTTIIMPAAGATGRAAPTSPILMYGLGAAAIIGAAILFTGKKRR